MCILQLTSSPMAILQTVVTTSKHVYPYITIPRTMLYSTYALETTPSPATYKQNVSHNASHNTHTQTWQKLTFPAGSIILQEYISEHHTAGWEIHLSFSKSNWYPKQGDGSQAGFTLQFIGSTSMLNFHRHTVRFSHLPCLQRFGSLVYPKSKTWLVGCGVKMATLGCIFVWSTQQWTLGLLPWAKLVSDFVQSSIRMVSGASDPFPLTDRGSGRGGRGATFAYITTWGREWSYDGDLVTVTLEVCNYFLY